MICCFNFEWNHETQSREAFTLYFSKLSSLFPLLKFLIKFLFLYLNLFSYIHYILLFVPLLENNPLV